MKNTYKFHFASNVAGRIFLKMNFFIECTHPTFQRRVNIVSTFWITVEITLIRRWKWNKNRSLIFNIAQHWYVFVQRWSNVKSTLHIVDPNIFEHCFNVDMASSQVCLNMASTSVKAILKPIWLVKSMDLQKDW